MIDFREKCRLSERELELIGYASEGFTDAAIAQQMGISAATVSTYWGRVRVKLGPHNRTELVAKVLLTELRRTVGELKERNAKLTKQLERGGIVSHDLTSHEIVESAPEAILAVTEGLTIYRANTVAHRVFGYSKGSLVGLDLERLVPVQFRDALRHQVSGYLRHDSERSMGALLITPGLHRSGSEFMIRASLSQLKTPQGASLTWIIRPVGCSRAGQG